MSVPTDRISSVDLESLGWTVKRAPLEGGVFGDIFWPTKMIIIDPQLPAAVQRSTLAHEIEHALRGPLPTEPVLAAREELTVEKTAARRLIDVHDLGEALVESDNLAHVAYLLDVDVPLLEARLKYLHPVERTYLTYRVQQVS